MNNCDALRIIFSHLSTADLCRNQRVCKQWKRVIDDDLFWKKICQSTNPENEPPVGKTWKEWCIESTNVLKRNLDTKILCECYSSKILSLVSIGKTLYSGNSIGYIQAWDVNDGKRLATQLTTHSQSVMSLVKEHEALLAMTYNNEIKKYEFEKDNPEFKEDKSNTKESNLTHCDSTLWQNQNVTLKKLDDNNLILKSKINDFAPKLIETSKYLDYSKEYFTCADIKGRLLYLGSSLGNIRVLDLPSGKFLRIVDTGAIALTAIHAVSAETIAYALDGRGIYKLKTVNFVP